MTGSKDVRLEAAKFYERALKGAAPGCCGASPNAFAAAAGYSEADLCGMPNDAALNSFGCGNPVAFAQVSPGQTVVDLGSGVGLDLLIAARAVGPTGTVIGVDISEVMLARARDNMTRAGVGNVELRQGVIEELPIETASADWVISNCVINLSPDKRAVFAQIHRVLKPGGRMLVSDIVADGLPSWFRDDPNLRAACIAGALPEPDYLAAARAGGLVEIEIVGRLVYDDDQVRALVTDALPTLLDTIAAAARRPADEVLQEVVAAAHGRVASVRVAARRSA
ncbi:MAG TPA: methyltransferase domain-containing protein [Caulobacteraceae bacterium]|nr:methyltransferase domain-containing protein [Caulobacteraceae bacterium]